VLASFSVHLEAAIQTGEHLKNIKINLDSNALRTCCITSFRYITQTYSDITSPLMRVIIDYMYTGTVDMYMCEQILPVAKSLGINRLVQIIIAKGAGIHHDDHAHAVCYLFVLR
jgi:hypothetical protein